MCLCEFYYTRRRDLHRRKTHEIVVEVELLQVVEAIENTVGEAGKLVVGHLETLKALQLVEHQLGQLLVGNNREKCV